MTRPWWDSPRAEASLDEGRPVLLPGGRSAAIAALQQRIAGYVPEWRDLTEEDAGVALVRLFGVQLDPILSRTERLPEKALVEFLRAAGVTLSPARSAAAIVTFVPEESNEQTVQVPEGTQLKSPPAGDEEGDVTWETDEGLSVPNVALAERHAFDGEVAFAAGEDEAFAALGERPETGAALYLGFSGSGSMSGELSLLFEPASDGAPQPVAVGGPPAAALPPAELRWEAMTDRGFQSVNVESDSSDTLTRTGILRMELPSRWLAGRPAVLGEGESLYWLRLRVAGGRLDTLRLRRIGVHAVTVTAQQTFRDEFPVPESDGDSVRIQLARAPVRSGSLVLEVDEGAEGADLFDLEDSSDSDGSEGTFRRWEEVETLAGQAPDARVFVLDSASGLVSFGDGREGRAPSPGIRSIVIRSYAVTRGSAGNVAAGEIADIPARIPGIAEVSNPLLAAGGVAVESEDEAIARGPAMVKARGRAVSAGDMALLARFAPGAGILHAHAQSGVDPLFPGANRPGTVGVFVVPRRHPSEPTDAPPVPTSETLSAVATYLAEQVGPLGARVVVASPRYEEVRIDATINVSAGADAALAESAVRSALDTWLSPETGDWAIGPTMRHNDLVHRVLDAHPDIVSVPFLAIALDGIGLPACSDIALRPQSLPWPGQHRLAVEVEEAST